MVATKSVVPSRQLNARSALQLAIGISILVLCGWLALFLAAGTYRTVKQEVR